MERPSIWIPVLLLLTATAIFRFTNVDLILSRPFFVQQNLPLDSEAHWPLKIAQPWKSLYEFGVYPAWVIGLGGLFVFFVSFFLSKLKPYRDAGLFLALARHRAGFADKRRLQAVLGTSAPNQTIPFGGQDEYLPVGEIGRLPEGALFPSGHASMGFYLMTPAFLFYRRRPCVAAAFFALGLAGGTIMGVARIVAGSHFASDVVWSAGMVYFIGLALAALFRFGKTAKPTGRSPWA